MLTMEQGGWSDVLNDCKKTLHSVGIPVQSKDQTQVSNQFRFHLRKVANDLVGQCDVFHIAKHAMKFVAFNHEYDISNLPIDSAGVVNDLVLNLESTPSASEALTLHESQLQNVLFFAPNVNSIRRIKKRKNGQLFKTIGDSGYEIAIAAPDANLYLGLASLFSTPPSLA